MTDVELVHPDVEANAEARRILGERFGIRQMVVHDSYLINLASPDDTLRARSLQSFAAELGRCEALGIDLLVSHPGNFIDEREAGIARNADAIVQALELAPGRTVVCLETTAGSGTRWTSPAISLRRLLREPARRVVHILRERQEKNA